MFIVLANARSTHRNIIKNTNLIEQKGMWREELILLLYELKWLTFDELVWVFVIFVGCTTCQCPYNVINSFNSVNCKIHFSGAFPISSKKCELSALHKSIVKVKPFPWDERARMHDYVSTTMRLYTKRASPGKYFSISLFSTTTIEQQKRKPLTTALCVVKFPQYHRTEHSSGVSFSHPHVLVKNRDPHVTHTTKKKKECLEVRKFSHHQIAAEWILLVTPSLPLHTTIYCVMPGVDIESDE